MKAKLVIFGKKSEIVTKDGKTFKPKRGESQKDFTSRIKKEIPGLELTEMDFKKVKAYASKALQKSVAPETGKAKGLFREMIIQVLTDRGLMEAPKKEAPKKPAAKKTEKTMTPPDAARQEALEAFKNSREYKKAKKNVGKTVQYTSRTYPDKTRTGVVKGLLINRKADKAYYMILNTETGKRESCTLDSIVA